MLVFSIMCFFGVAIFAQQQTPNISFSLTQHDFGAIEEDGGVVTNKFEFTNTGNQPLIISSVKASCGCTTPKWTNVPVPPGGTGFVSAAYNPKGRPGPFNKTITVTSNAEQERVVLTISGDVKPREKTVEDEYPQIMGNLRLKTNRVNFSTIFNSEKRTEEIEVINPSTEPLKLAFESVPSHIKITLEPKYLQAQEKGKILVTYDAKMKNDWGTVSEPNIMVVVNGKKEAQNNLYITANIEEDFSKLSAAQLAKAPIFEVEKETFEFGELKQGESVEHEFKFKNTGSSDLIIRKTQAACGCTAVTLGETVIKPGKEGSIKTKFNSAGKTGRQNKTITVTTNDPKKPKIVLWIKGDVK